MSNSDKVANHKTYFIKHPSKTSISLSLSLMGSSSYQRAQSQTISSIDLVGCSREVRGHKVVEPEDGNGAVVNGEFLEFVGFKHAGGDSIDSFDTGKNGVFVRKGDGVEEGC